jgi:hypothetical protein
MLNLLCTLSLGKYIELILCTENNKKGTYICLAGVRVNATNSPALGFIAVQVGSKIVPTVVRRFMMFVHSKTMKQDSARGTFVLIVGMHANHQ